MAVEFRLLGAVEAWRDGRPIDIGHMRQRCVLAALLIDANRLVTSGQLVERVWADERPYNARNALAAYVSRLRHLFAADPGVQIARQPGGYVMSTETDAVDLHRFRGLVAEGRSATDPAAALATLDRALSLWRGEPLSPLETPWVADVRHGLAVERFSAELDRNDAALAAGRHAQIVGGLASAVHEHPLDERLAAQLMVALYRSGRQAEALDTYRAMRERLVEDLGVEPSPTLRAAHQQILDGDPGSAATGPSLHATPAPPATLPRRPTSFIGRAADVEHVVAALRDGAVLTLTGVGGVGKTRLALESARAASPRFRDGAVLCELAPLHEGTAVAHTIATALRLQQRQGLDIEASMIEYLHSRELLLIVDNCEHVLDVAAGLIDRIVSTCPHVTVLATSREPLGVAGERLIAVAPLGADDAAALFADRARAGRPDFDPDREPVGAIAEICRQLDGLPLAIELAAARIRAMTSLDLARRLDGLRLLRGGARGASPRQQSVTATIDWSYRLLTSPEQELFIRLSVFAGGFDLDAAHGVCGEAHASEEDTLDALTGLVDRSMVTVRSETLRTRYVVLETLRAYGRERLAEHGLSAEVSSRHAEYFTRLAEHAAAGMHSADEQAWVERVLPDYDNMRVAFEHAVAAGDTDSALRLVTSLPEFVHLRIGFEASGWAERILARVDADHPLFPAAVGFAARGAWNRGDHAHARALASGAHGRRPGRGSGRVAYPGDVLADVALYEGDPATALTHYAQEMQQARREDDPIRLVWTLFYVAICQAALRTPQHGRPAAQEAVEVADTTGNPTARSMARYALGLVLKKSDPDEALTLFDAAAELAASVQNFWWHGIALMEAASTRAVHGDPARAARDLVAVLDHWDRVGDWSQQWLNLRYVTRLLARLGNEADAAVLHRALENAGRPSPLHASPDAQARALTGPEAVVYARAVLSRCA